VSNLRRSGYMVIKVVMGLDSRYYRGTVKGTPWGRFLARMGH
jgi:hypothetical protein